MDIKIDKLNLNKDRDLSLGGFKFEDSRLSMDGSIFAGVEKNKDKENEYGMTESEVDDKNGESEEMEAQTKSDASGLFGIATNSNAAKQIATGFMQKSDTLSKTATSASGNLFALANANNAKIKTDTAAIKQADMENARILSQITQLSAESEGESGTGDGAGVSDGTGAGTRSAFSLALPGTEAEETGDGDTGKEDPRKTLLSINPASPKGPNTEAETGTGGGSGLADTGLSGSGSGNGGKIAALISKANANAANIKNRATNIKALSYKTKEVNVQVAKKTETAIAAQEQTTESNNTLNTISTAASITFGGVALGAKAVQVAVKPAEAVPPTAPPAVAADVAAGVTDGTATAGSVAQAGVAATAAQTATAATTTTATMSAETAKVLSVAQKVQDVAELGNTATSLAQSTVSLINKNKQKTT